MRSIETLIASMRIGNAEPLTVDQMDKIEAEGWIVRTALNRSAVGLLSAPYIGWMSGPVSTSPPDLRIETRPDRGVATQMRAFATAGRCVFTKTGLPLPPDYFVTIDHAKH